MRLIILALVCSVLGLLTLVIGPIGIPLFSEISPEQALILSELRMPKMITALCAGGLLSVAGLFMQVYFQNPLVGPYILGIPSGASFGVALWYLLAGGSLSFFGVFGFSVIGGLGTLAVIVMIAPFLKQKTFLLIFGLLLSQLLAGLVQLMTLYAPSENLRAFLIWGMGSFERLSLEMALYLSLLTLILVFCSLLMSKSLNTMLLGDRYAQSMGVNLKHVRFFLILLSGLMASVVAATAGPIAFVGVLIPHLARWYFSEHRHHLLILGSFFLGGIFCLSIQLLNLLLMPYSLPINAWLALLSAPFMILFLFRLRGRSYVF